MFNYSWENECRTQLLVTVCGHWDWDDYHHSISTIKDYLATVSHHVIVLVDARDVRHIPKDAFEHMSIEMQNMPHNLKAQILVSENRWLESIFAIINHLLPELAERFIFVRTMEKARKKIEILSRPSKKKRRKMAQLH